MKIIIQKFKSSDGRVPNYFQTLPAVSLVDTLILDDSCLFEKTISDYTDEILQRDKNFSYTAGDYSVNFSLLSTAISVNAYNVGDFFDPATDLDLPVGYLIAYGIDENNIERGDFITVSSIKSEKKQNDDGYILSFSVVGAEEHFIQRAESFKAQPLSEAQDTRLGGFFAGLLTSQVFDNVNVSNHVTGQLLERGITTEPYISWYLYNKVLDGYSNQSRWNVFKNFTREHGMAYRLVYADSIEPNALGNFTFHIFFMSKPLNINETPVVLEDESYKEGITLDYASQHVVIYYVSYTSALLPSQDWLGSVYINKNEATVGYTNLDAYGLVEGNQTNNIFKNYKTGDFIIRNNKAILDKDCLFLGTERVFIFTSAGVSIGISIGRCMVRGYNITRFHGNITGYTDTGFNVLAASCAFREYRFLAAGVTTDIDIAIKYELNSPYKLNTQFPLDGKNYTIHKVYDREEFETKSRIYAVRYPV